VRERYPELSEEDQESVRQHAIAALNLTQRGAGESMRGGGDEGDPDKPRFNTALLDGIRRYALSVTELDIDLIDHINPFETAYSILSKTMNEKNLEQVAAKIAARRINLTHEEARALAVRALQFRKERGRLPSLTAADAWEKRLAEGVEYLRRHQAEQGDG
jgi:hypothetical protein